MPLTAPFFASIRSPLTVDDGSGLMRDLYGVLPQSAVDGLNLITQVWEDYAGVKCLDDLAYIMATAYRECGPALDLGIEEIGRGKGKPYGVPAGQYQLIYYGRGPVQLTWLTNYQKFKIRLKLDIVQHPDLVLKHDVGTLVMIDGMYAGMFTKKALRNYIDPAKQTSFTQYRLARQIVNGLDHADEVARNAMLFRAALAVGYDKPAAKTAALKPLPQPVARTGFLAMLARWYLKGG